MYTYSKNNAYQTMTAYDTGIDIWQGHTHALLTENDSSTAHGRNAQSGKSTINQHGEQAEHGRHQQAQYHATSNRANGGLVGQVALS